MTSPPAPVNALLGSPHAPENASAPENALLGPSNAFSGAGRDVTRPYQSFSGAGRDITRP